MDQAKGVTAGFARECAIPSWLYVPITNLGTTKVTWGATDVAGANYVLEESTDPGFATSKVVYNGNETSVTLSGYLNGTYYYRIRATATGYNPSPWQAGTVGWTVNVACRALSWLYISQTNLGSNTLKWGATDVAGATYVLEESTDPGFTASKVVYSGSETSVTLTSYLNGTYYYRVRATATGYNPSPWQYGSNAWIVNVSLRNLSWLYVPGTSLSTTTLNWGATDIAGATYVLEESTDPGFATSSIAYSGTATSTTLSGRLNGTYYYRVRATATDYNPSAWQVGSAPWVVNVTLRGLSWLYVPGTSLSTNTLKWGATDLAGAIYVLEESTDPSFAISTEVYRGPSTSATLTGRASGSYYYRVHAILAGYNPSPIQAGSNEWTVN
jgi:hypothetical protein